MEIRRRRKKTEVSASSFSTVSLTLLLTLDCFRRSISTTTATGAKEVLQRYVGQRLAADGIGGRWKDESVDKREADRKGGKAGELD